MIDTHSHIYGPEFDDDRSEVVDRARQAGVERILLPNCNEETIQPMLRLCASYPGYCYPMLGLHPTDLDTNYQSVLDHMHQQLLAPGNPYVAVGEVGLDYYWDRTYYREQQDAFEQQIDWARECHLPLMIHARSAHRELVDMMMRHRDDHLTGVFHCFGGTVDEAQELLQFLGFCLGIGGVSTYKKSTIPEVLERVPLDRIVLETDSPYLAPVPFRGKRNESAHVSQVLLKVAQVMGMTPVEVERQTNENVFRIFTRLKADYACKK